MRALHLGTLLLVLPLAFGCSVIVEGQLTDRDAGGDAGGGESCSFDAQCISLDPFGCNRVCGEDGFCRDGVPPEGTACGTRPREICVEGDTGELECLVSTCGDGYVDRTATPPEYCDDGNDNPDDGCNNMCTRSCAPPAPAECGDADDCNGQESCMTVMALAFCRASGPEPDGTVCDADGVPGTCDGGECFPD